MAKRNVKNRISLKKINYQGLTPVTSPPKAGRVRFHPLHPRTYVRGIRGLKITGIVQKKPLTSFFLSLVLLLGVIAASSFLFKPKSPVPPKEILPKEVQIYKIGTAPRLVFQAQIEKIGVVKITSQVGGIVQKINVREGTQVGKGTTLLNLSTNYQGGNAASLQSAIAIKQNQITVENFDNQKAVIDKQRVSARAADTNADKLRQIAGQSVDETQSLANLNQQILDTLDQNLQNLEATNSGDLNRSTILQTRQLKSQFQAALNQIKASLRSLEYQSDSTNPPQQTADLQRDITLKQLDIQEKSLEIGKDISRLQLNLAYVNASLFFPASPFTGTVDKIFVKEGQLVNPGMPLVLFSGKNKALSANAKIPESVAKKISKLEKSRVFIGNKILEISPSYVSTEATDGQLYSVVYSLPEENLNEVTDGQFLPVEIPIGYPDTGSAIPFVPLDAVFQTQKEAIVYVVKDDSAKSRTVKLGSVFGRFIQITSGLETGDQIIVNRNVIEGDKVKVTGD